MVINKSVPHPSAQHPDDISFRLLHLIETHPGASKREIANELGVSVGAVNYILRAVISSGFVRYGHLPGSKDTPGCVYVLTSDGLMHRANLAAGYLERKFAEYDAMMAAYRLHRAEFVARGEGA